MGLLNLIQDTCIARYGEAANFSCSCGYRCQVHNDRLPGSVPNSEHVQGMAADCLVPECMSVDEFGRHCGRLRRWRGGEILEHGHGSRRLRTASGLGRRTIDMLNERMFACAQIASVICGAPAEILYSQWAHESTNVTPGDPDEGKPFCSDLAKDQYKLWRPDAGRGKRHAPAGRALFLHEICQPGRIRRLLRQVHQKAFFPGGESQNPAGVCPQSKTSAGSGRAGNRIQLLWRF